MNDIKQRITSQNILSIIDEEAIKHLSSLRGTSRKSKDELVHSSVCIKKSITPYLNSTRKVKRSNDALINISNSLNNVTKFTSQHHIETKSKPFKSEHKRNSHNKPKIPISTNQTTGNTAINILKLDNLSNSFFNTKTSSTKSNNAMHMNAKKKLFNLSFSKEHNYKSLNNNHKSNNNDVHSLGGTTKYSPHHNVKGINAIHHKRYLSSRQNSNDVPTRSDSISNNNCQKNIDQTFAFSPLQKVGTRNRSFHTNEQNEGNNNNNTNRNTNNNNNNNVNNNIIPYHPHHDGGKKKVNKKLHKSKTKKIGNTNDNQKDAKKKNQSLFLLDDKLGNNSNNNNFNKETNPPKNEDLPNKKIENLPTSESTLKLINKQCFLCCIPLFKSKNNKHSSP